MVNLIYEQSGIIELSRESNQNYLWYYDYFFDGHVWEVYFPLTNGRIIYLIEGKSKTDVDALTKYCTKNKIHVAAIPPAILTIVDMNMLNTLIVAGDITDPNVIRSYIKKKTTNVINSYGPTEVTVCSTIHVFKAGDINTTIGHPISNTTTYV